MNNIIKTYLNYSVYRESVLQSRESFLAWNEHYPKEKVITSPGKPLPIEIQKTAFFLGIYKLYRFIFYVMLIGLEIMSKKGQVIINEIIEDGAAFNDGFLQVKYCIISTMMLVIHAINFVAWFYYSKG